MKLIDDWKRARALLKRDGERKAIAKKQIRRLLELRLIKPKDPGIYNGGGMDPTLEIGAALRLADQYGVKVHGGICYGTVRAILPQEKWRGIADWEHCPADNTGWWGWCERGDVPEAVCCCLINCREQGIL